MNVRIEKIASLVLVSLTIFGLMTMNIDTVAAQYPPLPFLYVAVSGNTADIYLMGDGFTDLDPYWDINGLDIVLRFDASAMQAIVPGSAEEMIDPDYWFAGFWPAGIVKALPYPGYAIDNVNGYVRVVIVGLPLDGFHIAPYGQGRVMSVTFDNPITTPMRLEKLPPERPELPDFGPEYFAVDLAQFDTGLPIPFVGGPPEAFVTIPHAVAGLVEFNAFSAYSPTTIVSYEWDMDNDGIFETSGPGPLTVYYEQPGFYKAPSLKVTDYLGNVDIATSDVLINVQTILQNAYVEHKVFVVSADEDGLNTLYCTARNLGNIAGNVKAEFQAFDKRTGLPVGPTLVSSGVVEADSRLDLMAQFDPALFEWEPGTEADYEISVTLFCFDGYAGPHGSWVASDTFKTTFKVRP